MSVSHGIKIRTFTRQKMLHCPLVNDETSKKNLEKWTTAVRTNGPKIGVKLYVEQQNEKSIDRERAPNIGSYQSLFKKLQQRLKFYIFNYIYMCVCVCVERERIGRRFFMFRALWLTVCCCSSPRPKWWRFRLA